jgi:hypothetical protein
MPKKVLLGTLDTGQEFKLGATTYRVLWLPLCYQSLHSIGSVLCWDIRVGMARMVLRRTKVNKVSRETKVSENTESCVI